MELKLPVDGKPDEYGPTQAKRRTLGTSRRAPRGRKPFKHMSTNKEVLERLKCFHPLPGVILEWRRVNCALTKVVFIYIYIIPYKLKKTARVVTS